MAGFSVSRRSALPALAAIGALTLALCTSTPAYAAGNVPNAPTAVSATPGNGTAVVKWTAPSYVGPGFGYYITGYTATTSPSGKTCTTTGAVTCTIHDLKDGTNYSITVKAKNKKGYGPASAKATVKPGVPLKPTGVKATVGNEELTVRWTAAANNGSTITKYTVTSSPGSKTCVTTGAVTCIVTSLTNDTAYTFKVTATNARGTGSASSPSAAVTPTLLGKSFPVGDDPFGVSSDGTHVWVANDLSNSVTELNASDGSLVQTIAVGNHPYGVSSDATHVWVANNTDSTVTELNASDGSVVQTIPVGDGQTTPPGFGLGADAISSDGVHVWVTNDANNNNGTVTELDAVTGAVEQTIPTGNLPDGVSSDGTHVWVANEDDGTVTELNASDGSLVQTIPVGNGPSAISSDGTHVWVTNAADDTVTELVASTGAVVQTIPVGSEPDGVSSDGTHVWVTNYEYNPAANNSTVTEIDASTGSVVQSILLPGSQAPLGVSSDSADVWVATSALGTVTEFPA
jgi:YVTN family beta-propeller protein